MVLIDKIVKSKKYVKKEDSQISKNGAQTTIDNPVKMIDYNQVNKDISDLIKKSYNKK